MSENVLFETAPIPKAYMKLALPVVMGMVVSLVYNMVDTYFIAKTGNTDLVAGVALGAPVFTLMIALGDIFGLGGSSMVSRLFGEKREDRAKKVSSFCVYSAVVIGIGVAGLMLLFRGPILKLLGADSQTMEYASSYYTFLAIGAPAVILSFSPMNLLRTEGLATASMIGSMVGTVMNIILDPIFIFTLGYGAGGAAIATVLGNVCADVVYLWFMKRKCRKLSVDIRKIGISNQELLGILAIGIPASVTNLTQSFAIMMTNRFLRPYGNSKVAAMGISMKVAMIAMLVIVGFAFGPQPLIGYNYGAKNYKRLKETMRFSYVFLGCLSIVMAAVLSMAAPYILKGFMDKPEIVQEGTRMLRFLLSSMLFVSITLVTTTAFQSSGKALGAFLLAIGRQGVIFLAVLLIASKVAGYYGILAAQPVADLLTAALAVILFRKSLYKEMKNVNMQK